MDVSIVILTKNAGDRFRNILQRVFSQKFSGEYEVIVIDSGSIDDTVSMAQSFPVKMTRIKPEEFHHGRTRNLGAKLSIGRTLVYLTQDAFPLHEDWLQKLTECLKDPKVAMVVGRQIPWEDTKPPEKFFYRYYFPEHKIEVCSGVSHYYHDNIFISNVNSAIKRSVWQDLMFSENIVRGEDKEFARRVLLGGWGIVYQPEAVVRHAHDLGLWSVFRTSLDIGKALSQGAGMPRSKNWIAERLGYFFQEAWYMASREEWWKWLPYSVAYEVSKLLGTAIGWIKFVVLSILKYGCVHKT
jgi:rhamnosyltransferase